MRIPLIALGALQIPAASFAQPAPGDPSTPTPTLAPPDRPAPPPVPAPASYTSSQSRYQEVIDAYSAPMFTTGALVFAGSYGTSVIVAGASSNDRGNERLYVPVLGPWLALNDRGSCDITRSSCDRETSAKVLLVADGVFQAAGIIGMLDGVLQPTSRRVVTRSAKLDTKLHVKPTAVHGDPGIAVWARF